MKKFLLLFLITCVEISFAQNINSLTGKVLDAKTNEPLPFVNILVNGGRQGTSSNLDGKFTATSFSEIDFLEFSFVGYEKKRVDVSQLSPKEREFLTVFLDEKSDQLEEVTVLPGINPAHRIIKKTVENRAKNNPENLPGFSYRTYSKFIASIYEDSLDMSIDTTSSELYPDSTIIDSNDVQLANFLSDKHLFMTEAVTERYFIKGKRDNETVLASRASGFKSPFFSLITTQLQSFSFYEDYISIAGSEFLNPLTPASTKRYFFLLEDTAYSPQNDTIFIISFRPKPNSGFVGMKGVLYINESDWALQNVLARPAEDEGFYIEIEQFYQKLESTWFPEQLNAHIHFANIELNNVKPFGKIRTYLKDVDLNPELRKGQVSRSKISLPEEAGNDLKLLDKYRADTLSAKEERTFEFVDSVSEAENFEKKLGIALALSRGYVPIKFINLDLSKLFNYNVYEGFRLGLGGETNDKLAKNFRVGGYFGYGFRDKTLKYGWHTKVFLNRNANWALEGGYRFDIFETGGSDFIQKENRGLLANNYRRLYIPQWDETTRWHAAMTYDPLPQLKLKTEARRENRFTVGDYFFENQSVETAPQFENGFNYFEIITALQWSPRTEYLEAEGIGILAWEPKTPLFDLQYTRGLDGVWGSEFEYHKLDLRIQHTIQTVRIGLISMELQTGTVLQELPQSKLYVGRANLRNTDDIWKRFGTLADRNSFETMFFNEFLMDNYVHLMYRHDFKSLIFKRKEFAPHIELVARALWGGLQDPGRHEGIDFQTPTKGFYEAGLELNRLVRLGFTRLGLGFYYRMGAYQNPDFVDNIAVKLTNKFSF